MDATRSDRVQMTVDGRTAQVPRGTTILNAARQMGVSIPTLCNYRGLTPYGACRVCMVELETPRGAQLVASCSHPVEDRPGRPHRNRDVSASRGGPSWSCSWPRPPTRAELAAFAANLGVQVDPLRAGRRRKMRSLRPLRADLQRNDGPRGHQHLRPRRRAGSPHRLWPTNRPVPGVRGLRVRLPHRRRRPGHDHRPAAQAAPDRVRQVPRAAGPHRPGPSPGVAARAGHRPRDVHPLQDRAVRAVRRRSARPRPSTTISPKKTIELEVGSVVLTPGFEAFDATRRGEFGFGFAPNVLSNVQFERLLSAAGPRRGTSAGPATASRPSGWPSSSASARATRAATTTTAPRSAAWPPPRRRSSPRSTSRGST